MKFMPQYADGIVACFPVEMQGIVPLLCRASEMPALDITHCLAPARSFSASTTKCACAVR